MKPVFGTVLHREFIENDRTDLLFEIQAMREGLVEDERPMAMRDAFASLWPKPKRGCGARRVRYRSEATAKGETSNAVD